MISEYVGNKLSLVDGIWINASIEKQERNVLIQLGNAKINFHTLVSSFIAIAGNFFHSISTQGETSFQQKPSITTTWNWCFKLINISLFIMQNLSFIIWLYLYNDILYMNVLETPILFVLYFIPLYRCKLFTY